MDMVKMGARITLASLGSRLIRRPPPKSNLHALGSSIVTARLCYTLSLKHKLNLRELFTTRLGRGGQSPAIVYVTRQESVDCQPDYTYAPSLGT